MNKESHPEGGVQTSIENGVAIIEFFHPASNSLPGKILMKLANAITEAGENEEAKVIILKSSGDRAFCAGASFDELISIEDETTGKEFFMGFARVINAMRKAPKLIIGRVQGKTVGGGVGLASSVDYCLATEYAAVKLSELAIGIGPFVVGPAVQRKLGVSGMSQLAINATEWKSAEWAEHRGLFAEVYKSTEELDEAVLKLAHTLSKSNPEAMQELKTTFWDGTDNWDQLLSDRAAMSGKLVLSDFTRNAIQKFKESVRKKR